MHKGDDFFAMIADLWQVMPKSSGSANSLQVRDFKQGQE
jgi:hypothetical protein